jgi:hypothetical protein
MVKKVYNCYINSANRDKGEKVYNFRVDFPTNHIHCEDDETISLNVLSFDMMNSMYNVSAINNNNQFTIKRTNADGITRPIMITYTIPDGNYDVITFTAILNSLLSVSYISVKYNQSQNTLTYTNIDTNTYRYFLYPLGKSNKLLGISSPTELLSGNGTTGTYINMVNYNKILLRVDNISFDRFNYENIDDTDTLLNNGNIMFWTTKTDIPPFKMISYYNIDGGSSFNNDLFDTQVDAITLRLTNEYNQLITDAPDYFLSLQFIITKHEETDISTTTKKLLVMVNEIFDLFMMFMKYIGFFKDIKK